MAVVGVVVAGVGLIALEMVGRGGDLMSSDCLPLTHVSLTCFGGVRHADAEGGSWRSGEYKQFYFDSFNNRLLKCSVAFIIAATV